MQNGSYRRAVGKDKDMKYDFHSNDSPNDNQNVDFGKTLGDALKAFRSGEALPKKSGPREQDTAAMPVKLQCQKSLAPMPSAIAGTRI